MSNTLKEQYASSPLYGSNAAAVEAMYEQFVADPDSIPEGWRRYFRTLGGDQTEVLHSPIRQQIVESARAERSNRAIVTTRRKGGVAGNAKQAAVSRMIQVYCLRGHQIADLDPLNLAERHVPGVLKHDYLGLTDADMDTEFVTGGLAGTGERPMKLREIIALLKKIYCGKVGAEFAHVSRARERLWLRKHFENGMVSGGLDESERRWLLEQLTAAEGIERYHDLSARSAFHSRVARV